jgi:hypothetical protein
VIWRTFPSPPNTTERQHLVGQDLLRFQDSRSHTHRHTRLLYTSDEPNAETFTLQQASFTRNRHPCPLRDYNSQPQQVNGRRPRGLRRTLQKRQSKIHVTTGGRSVRPSRRPALPWHHDHLLVSIWNITVYKHWGTPSNETVDLTLFCGCCNFKRRMSSANFQANKHTLL